MALYYLAVIMIVELKRGSRDRERRYQNEEDKENYQRYWEGCPGTTRCGLDADSYLGSSCCRHETGNAKKGNLHYPPDFSYWITLGTGIKTESNTRRS